MKIYLEKAIFVNRAPFDKREFDFGENEIAVLTSINGSGKTTLLSHIVDSFYEIAKTNFPQEFEDKQNKYYRVSSIVHNLIFNQPSFVYFRFKTVEGYVDYVDIRNKCTEDQYNEAIKLENKIPFNYFYGDLEKHGYVKKYSSNLDKNKVKELFSTNLMTYFPAYRYEQPGYLNDPYKVNLDFSISSKFAGYLNNPIEVISGLPQLANWILDIVLDISINEDTQDHVFKNLNEIITKVISSKNVGDLRLGIGTRNYGSARIQIVDKKGKLIYPSIFNLSSGEAALFCLFGEIIRQADNNKNNSLLEEIEGIVLIDEVDKHLHIKLQKDILTKLFNLFPNVQFIISTHSPFFCMGLADILHQRSRIIDIESGFSIQLENDPQYHEVYEMIISENERFKKLYLSIQTQLEEAKPLQIITEGKNTEHIEHAIKVLDNSLLSKIKIISGAESKSGDQQLKNAFEIMSKGNYVGKFLFVWDCDSVSIANSVEENLIFYKFCFEKNTSNQKVKKGIENLYPEYLFSDNVYDEKETETDYGGYKRERIFNKSKFLSEIKVNDDSSIFEGYKPLIRKIKTLLDLE